MTEQPAGPRCGNNPNFKMSDGDRKAVDDFKARLALQASAKPYTDSAAWVDGDPLMEVIAVTVWEHCETGDGGIVHDDPRTIAAFAAAVARAHAAVPSAPADRAALSARLWKIAEHHIVAEWICCEPVDPKHELCAKGYAALGMARTLLVDSPEAWNPAAPLLDAVLAELRRGTADRAAVLTDEAALIELHCPDHGPQDQDGVWMDCHCPVAEDMRKRAAELRRMADEAQQPETPKRPPMDPVHILGIGAVEARQADTAGEQQ